MASNRVYTIGYGGKKPEAFFDELSSLNYDIVVDVREDPDHAYLGCYTSAREKIDGKIEIMINEIEKGKFIQESSELLELNLELKNLKNDMDRVLTKHLHKTAFTGDCEYIQA